MAESVIKKQPFNLRDFPTTVDTISNANLNNKYFSGLYHLTGNIGESPYGSGYGFLIVFGSDPQNGVPQNVRQIFYPHGTDKIFTRRKYQGTWNAWEQINSGWKKGNEVVGANTQIDLPSQYSELLIVVNINQSGNMQTFHLIKEVVPGSGVCYFREGGYDSKSTGGLVVIGVGGGKAFINHASIGTTDDYSSNSKITIYYR